MSLAKKENAGAFSDYHQAEGFTADDVVGHVDRGFSLTVQCFVYQQQRRMQGNIKQAVFLVVGAANTDLPLEPVWDLAVFNQNVKHGTAEVGIKQKRKRTCREKNAGSFVGKMGT